MGRAELEAKDRSVTTMMMGRSKAGCRCHMALLTTIAAMCLITSSPASAFVLHTPLARHGTRTAIRPLRVDMHSEGNVQELWLPGQGNKQDTAHTEQQLWLPSSQHVTRRNALRYSVLATGAAACSPMAAQASQGRDLPSLSVQAPKSSSVTLKNGGGKFPLVSFGLQVYDDEKARKYTLMALEAGVRNFFASVLAGNQKGFAKAIAESGIPREELYICGSVVSNRAKGFNPAYKATAKGCAENMEAFGVGGIDYLDQIMLDYPCQDTSGILGQWKAFEEMKEQGLTKSLSVSNFSPEQIDCILDDEEVSTYPCVNQLPFNLAVNGKVPGWGGSAVAVVQANKDRNCLVQAWAPLGGSTGKFNKKIQTACSTIGAKYDKTASQVALRWILQCGASFSTCSTKQEHFEEDLDIFDFDIESQDMLTLNTLMGRVAVQ